MQDDKQVRPEQVSSEPAAETAPDTAQIGNAKVKRPEKVSTRSIPDDKVE